jgi:signal transduction histidine kinase
MQRILERRTGCIKCLPPRDSVARQVIAHLGLLEQMGYQMKIPSDRDDVIHWQVFHGVKADATQGVGEAIENLPNLPRTQIAKLFRSVSEALTNVTQHAYM